MKLFLDSSTNYLYLSLVDIDVIDTYIRNGKNDHSETLIDALKLFLEKNNASVDDIDEVYVGRGPGSYTGVRISGTIAKVLCLVKEKKLYSFSTLDLLLASKINENGAYLSRIIAKKNHSYYKEAKILDGHIKLLTKDLFSIDDELVKYQNDIFIEVSDDVFNTPYLAKTILDEGLYQEEDYFTYVPNYLRSEING